MLSPECNKKALEEMGAACFCWQAHYAKYEPTILELKRKYETAMKEKMLAGLERDKMAGKVGNCLVAGRSSSTEHCLTEAAALPEAQPAAAAV